ncbi:MAG: hypothetical protein QJR09_02215 [Micrococcus sp.]|nr:hypothetical protein [Micrococcus sp.]
MPAPEVPGPRVPTSAGSGPPGRSPVSGAPSGGASSGGAPSGGASSGGAHRWRTALGAVLIGAGAGILGTVLHPHFAWLGEAVVPWGAVLALLLVASAQLWWTLRSSLAWAGGVTAIAAFSIALVLSSWPGLDTFAVALNEYTLRVVPGPAISGAVWLWGLPVVAVLTMVLAQPVLRVPAPRD